MMKYEVNTHHVWAGRHLGGRGESRAEVVRVDAGEGRRVGGEGVGGAPGLGELEPLLRAAAAAGVEELRHPGVRGELGVAGLRLDDGGAGDLGGRALGARPLPLLGSVLVVRVLQLVQVAELLCLLPEGGLLLLAQCLPDLAEILSERQNQMRKIFTLQL